MKNERFLKLVRGTIAIEGRSKTEIARKCGISRSQFSELIWGHRRMPESVKQRLIEELSLGNALESFAITCNAGSKVLDKRPEQLFPELAEDCIE